MWTYRWFSGRRVRGAVFGLLQGCALELLTKANIFTVCSADGLAAGVYVALPSNCTCSAR
ncbi:hypothetical protein PF003_g28044 [Phytophthora fragariae]|nr:hypothetical protein PF003_g28044 [Phytophthora fragariae]